MRAALIGRGAIGMLYAMQLRNHGVEPVFLVDSDRKKRYESEVLYINGNKTAFNYVVPGENDEPYDLVLIMTKSGGLADALETIEPAIDDSTILLSCINGIVSEEIVRARYPKNPVIRTIVQGMDTVFLNGHCDWQTIGEIVIGEDGPDQKETIRRLSDFFSAVEMPCVVSDDIVQAQWNKLMLNCAVNQICAVYTTTYGGIIGPYRPLAVSVMNEVRAVAASQGIELPEEYISVWMNTMEHMDADAFPSMAQDAKAHRHMETELFAGTIVPLAEKAGIDVPESKKLLEQLEQLEASFSR